MSKPTLSFSVSVVAAVLVLAGARAATAQQVVKLGEGETLTISGFVNATLFSDRGSFAGSFGNGQNAEWAALAQPGVSQAIFDGDVRNTRINFTFNAPPVLGKWAPRATIESDFFGSFVGTGAVSAVAMGAFELTCTERTFLLSSTFTMAFADKLISTRVMVEPLVPL